MKLGDVVRIRATHETGKIVRLCQFAKGYFAVKVDGNFRERVVSPLDVDIIQTVTEAKGELILDEPIDVKVRIINAPLALAAPAGGSINQPAGYKPARIIGNKVNISSGEDALLKEQDLPNDSLEDLNV